MKRLEFTYYIKNLSILYQECTINWPNVELNSVKNFEAVFKIWDDEVEPEKIMQSWKNLKEIFNSFLLAMKYLGNRKIEYSAPEFPNYYYDDKTFTPRNEEEVILLTKYLRDEISSFAVMSAQFPLPELEGHFTTAPSPLPLNMPFIPLGLRRLATIITLVDELVNYPDLQLKMAYMVLEELVTDKQVQDFKDIKNARNFVSHPICKGKEVLDLLNKLLPSAINQSATCAKFDRDECEHRTFVASFANKARQWARQKFEYEVSRLGGSIS